MNWLLGIDDNSDDLMHYGVGHLDGGHSGRYEWGSGEDPYQHAVGFTASVNELKKQGLSETEIAKALEMTTTELRARKSIAKDNIASAKIKKALELKEQGLNNVDIGKAMANMNNGVALNESSVRELLKADRSEKADATLYIADKLKDNVDSKKYVDIGTGVEKDLGVTRTKLDTAVSVLKDQGYTVNEIYVPQVADPSKNTTMKVLCQPGTDGKELYKHRDEITTITDYSPDGGYTYNTVKPPVSINSDRVYIRYAENGGKDRDGTIELRRGVDDISLGSSSYAQVRIAVDGSHYLKGMALYSDNIPEGYDIIVNTNKKDGTDKYSVFKEMKKNKDGSVNTENPFGAVIKAGGQRMYTDENGEEKQSAINIIKETGDWSEYSKTLSSQFLSKQPIQLIKKQLNLSYSEKAQEFQDICDLTNNEVKKKLLSDFAEQCDSDAVKLKAAALPGQATKVILPVTTLKDNEIYAPTYKNGDTVALVRYPHAGTFEIPVLTVNNNSKTAKNVVGSDAIDAVGINSKVAERLSGADFDGDTVMVIPCNSDRSSVRIKSTAPLKDLVDFDSKDYGPDKVVKDDNGKEHYYRNGHEYTRISSQEKQKQMGVVSNLITDMTLQGATPEEMARAVKHSMVVIDSEKHKLDYKQSYEDNQIAALHKKYQGSESGGAATIISRAKGQARITPRKEGAWVTDPETGETKKQYIDSETGKKLYTETPESYEKTYTLKNGETRTKTITRTQLSTKMYVADDANDLVSEFKHPKELVYANYANSLKALGNAARKEYLATPNSKTNVTAKSEYKEEVSSLKSKLNNALKNAPRERMAQLTASLTIESIKKDNPNIEKSDLKKEKTKALANARAIYGAKKAQVEITDREWEAIQVGAVSSSTLTSILNNTDMDKVRKMATPKTSQNTLSSAKQARIQAMRTSGYTIAEIADQMGVSSSTVSKYIKA